MNLNQLLKQKKAEILRQANNALARAHLTHYDSDGTAKNEVRLETLYNLMVHCINERDVTAMIHYSEKLAYDRFASGFDLQEVQAAFNVLEEVIWKQSIAECPPSDWRSSPLALFYGTLEGQICGR